MSKAKISHVSAASWIQAFEAIISKKNKDVFDAYSCLINKSLDVFEERGTSSRSYRKYVKREFAKALRVIRKRYQLPDKTCRQYIEFSNSFFDPQLRGLKLPIDFLFSDTQYENIRFASFWTELLEELVAESNSCSEIHMSLSAAKILEIQFFVGRTQSLRFVAERALNDALKARSLNASQAVYICGLFGTRSGNYGAHYNNLTGRVRIWALSYNK